MRFQSSRGSSASAAARPAESPPPRSGAAALSRMLRGLCESVLVGGGGKTTAKRGRLLLEALESRQMLAGDVEFMFTDGQDGAPPTSVETTSTSHDSLPVTTQAEGEAAPDLVQFAKDLEAAEVTFFGAGWCPACTEQKELFQDGGQHLPFVEVTNPDRTLNEIGTSEEIEGFPTWEFPDGSREVGVLDLATLSDRSGVPIPESENPTFAELGSQTVGVGSPLHLPVDAYDPDGGPLTVTVSVDDPSLLEASVISDNRSLRLDVEDFGGMVFELFEQRAPRPAERVIELANSGFYDGITFHRIVNDFVIQAGDPTGDGTGGSELGNFDDQFHPDLQHNRSGILSFAKTTDDTNNSQFFVTETATRHLDFNHSIFGQLVEGENVRDAISNMEADESGAPTTPITIDQASVFTDSENSVVMLKALGGTGETDVTVTVSDEDGNTHSEVISVAVAEDDTNSNPFLGEIPPPEPVPTGNPTTLQLESIDIEGDPVRYLMAQQSSEDDATVTIDESSGLVTVTPEDEFVGEVDVLVGVQAATATEEFDSQLVTFTFEEAEGDLATPTSLELDPSSDSGASDSDNITRDGTLEFHVEGVTEGATVEIVDTATESVIGSDVATGSSISITTSNIAGAGDGEFVLAARQRDDDQTSSLSPELTVVFDSTAPASVVSSAPRFANVGEEYLADLISVEEGSGLVYSLSAAPNGATIESATGVIEWTPAEEQLGNHTFDLELTDVAGNVRTESFSVEVGEEPIAGIRLELADLDGNVIDSVDAGGEFLLRMYGVDERSTFDLRGVFAAYTDILFNSELVRPVPDSTIEYGDDFTITQTGTLSDGLIDELGAATSNITPTDEREALIATVEMEALEAGNVNFRSEPADADSSEVLLFLRDDEVPSDEVAYGTAALAIGLGFELNDDAVTITADDGPTTIDVLANDELLSGDGPLTVDSVTQPDEGGTAAVEENAVTFTPDADFTGTATFTYQVSNPEGAQADATVTVTVSGVDQPPTGVPDEFTVVQGSGANALDVLANDSPAPDGGQTLTIVDVSESTEGATVAVADNGESIDYTAPDDFVGVDEFSYTLSDGELTTEVAVSVTVSTEDAPPTANPDAFTIDEDTPEDAYGVLDNDEPDDADEPFELHDVGTPTEGGTARISDDATQLVYTPAPDFHGVEEVTYSIRDDGGGIASTTVTFTVNPVNDPPPGNDRTVTISRTDNEREVHRLEDLPSNVDEDEAIHFSAVGSTSEGGTVRIGDDEASIFYTPPSGEFTGTDTFTYTVEDEGELTTEGTLTIQVTDFSQRSIQLTTANGSQSLQHFASSITLSGTNDLGESVNQTLEVSGEGTKFSELFPGEYTVHIPAIPFLQNASEPREIEIDSEPEDGDLEITAEIGRLRPEYLSVQDFLGSAKSHQILTAISPGSSALFAMPSSTVETVGSPVVDMSEDGATLTVGDSGGDDDSVEETFSADGDRRVQLRGRADDLRLFRIHVDGFGSTDDDADEESDEESGTEQNLDVAPQSLPITTGAESEAVTTGGGGEASSSLVLGDLQAEGESASAGSVTRADVFVPPVRPTASDIDPTADTDAAMAEVSTGLSVRSEAAESLAELEDLSGVLRADAIDAAISEN